MGIRFFQNTFFFVNLFPTFIGFQSNFLSDVGFEFFFISSRILLAATRSLPSSADEGQRIKVSIYFYRCQVKDIYSTKSMKIWSILFLNDHENQWTAERLLTSLNEPKNMGDRNTDCDWQDKFSRSYVVINLRAKKGFRRHSRMGQALLTRSTIAR